MRRILPQARLVATVTEKDAIEDVCAKRTDAVFVDELTGIAALLAGPSCASQPLRVIPLPTLRITLGVGATLENREVADEIRRGMDAVSEEGESARTLTSWGYFSPHSMEYISVLRSARRREQWLIGTIVIFAAFLALTAFSANRIRRQRNRIELAEGALRRSEQKLRLMADNLKEMVLAYDMNRCLVFANPAVERLTGYSLARTGEREIHLLDSSGRPLPHARVLGQVVPGRRLSRGTIQADYQRRSDEVDGCDLGAHLTMRPGDRSACRAASATSPKASSPSWRCATPNTGSANFWKASSCWPS